MMIRLQRFNTYLLLTAAAVAVGGCQSANLKMPKGLVSTLRLHVQTSFDGTKANQSVPVYREKPVWVTVDQMPFITEANVASASVVDGVGGFVLRIQFDQSGTVLLESCTAANRGRKIAIFSQFGKEIKDYRWLAAPVINRKINDGVLAFTPDATREEAEEIALGLNNVAKKVRTWVDK